mmetsp:Transcript_10360/g.23985  ORF Transcript_10360/g.23985 Transcript_10360/m.23985 type:complete len:96 (+) Transcript_10360:659-946(+)
MNLIMRLRSDKSLAQFLQVIWDWDIGRFGFSRMFSSKESEHKHKQNLPRQVVRLDWTEENASLSYGIRLDSGFRESCVFSDASLQLQNPDRHRKK